MSTTPAHTRTFCVKVGKHISLENPPLTTAIYNLTWVLLGTSGQTFSQSRRRSALSPHPPQLNFFDLHQASILVQGKPHYHLYKHKISRHAHPDLHPRSFDLWRYSSFLSRLSFFWPKGLVNIPMYKCFNTVDERRCSLCSTIHAFDAMSCLA